MIILPAMSDAQAASWHGLMDVYEHLSTGWTLIGGQMVHLHCAERGSFPPRPTDDIDAVIDVRAEPLMLNRFTDTLTDIGFAPDRISADGLQHRWRRDKAQLDVLLPDGIGERAASRTGVTGSPTLSTPGGTQALHRSEPVEITVEGRAGSILRPTLVGALVAKAAAHTSPGDSARQRHRYDFATLASLIAATDFRAETLSAKDRRRLSDMISVVLAGVVGRRRLTERVHAIATRGSAYGFVRRPSATPHCGSWRRHRHRVMLCSQRDSTSLAKCTTE